MKYSYQNINEPSEDLSIWKKIHTQKRIIPSYQTEFR